ncbi:hypothetical protein O3M35_008852 [Rhynocoris fuscipes]|uniref:Uncharacterized protein n=1 Tax=Rhynocoris fuscipes TaxID=488301 RepID=A0AAW1D7L6_9HEMI
MSVSSDGRTVPPVKFDTEVNKDNSVETMDLSTVHNEQALSSNNKVAEETVSRDGSYKSADKTEFIPPRMYESIDKGPYVVFIESKVERKGISRLHPMSLEQY